MTRNPVPSRVPEGASPPPGLKSVHVTSIEHLVPLERAAEVARAELAGLVGDEYDKQWRAWFKASETVQAAITEHATKSGANRYEVEQAVKAAVRHAEEDPAE